MTKINGKILENLILDTLKEFVILLDKDLNILFANLSAIDALGLPKEDIIGKHCYELWHQRKEPCINCPVVRAMKKKEPDEGEIVTPDGRYWYIKGYPVINEENQDIVGAVEIVQDITEKKKMEKEIQYLTFHDKLTGLYNRAFFEEELKRLDTKRQLPISILMGDLNGLKLVNDAFGHEKGDELLKSIAEVLRKSCRKEDIIARWGGDEFVIIFPKTSKEIAEKICDRIKQNCEEYNKTNNQTPIPLSIALGYATKEMENEKIDEILKIAEDRMYRNKLIEGKGFRDTVLQTLKELLWSNSYESKVHEERIKELATRMSDILYLSDIDREDLILLSHFHDIGEITIPSEILKKNTSLSKEEFKKIKTHPEVGYRIAEASYELTKIAEYILTHHEWWNGKEYPRGLKREEIPLVSRIFSIIDAYEVMTSGRPYKKAKTKEEAIEELKKCAGTQFDPNLVEVFLTIV